MKTDLDKVLEFAQATLAITPVVILGSGASAAHGVPGMWPLAQHLQTLAPGTGWTVEELTEWNSFQSKLAADIDLESALGQVRFTERQTARVAGATRAFLLPSDEAVFAQLLGDRRALPLTRLYRYLFKSTHRTLDVITPNYDRLAEYAADAGEFCHFTGFSSGYLQTRAKAPSGRSAASADTVRTVRVWKVHGSLDWFQDDHHQIVGARSVSETPAGYVPLMITPGIDKYRLAHAEPFRTIFSCSDAALETARSYLCVGYGFNDEHLQTKLIERCDAESVPIIVITKTLSDPAKNFLGGGRCRKYLALEEAQTGTRAYTNEEPGGIDLPGQPIWQLGAFLDLALGADI
ncbi:MAG TPA: SIR2 family protein [Allosphingosinicella sp.]|jgi:hypothetical protein